MVRTQNKNSFDIQLFIIPDRMHVINGWDEKTPARLPYMQLWEVEDGRCRYLLRRNLIQTTTHSSRVRRAKTFPDCVGNMVG